MSKFRTGELETRPSFDYLRGRLDAKSLLEDLGIEFSHKQGSYLQCHCPDWLGNHKNGDASPSFGFYPDEMRYNCFVCGGGDVLSLVENCTGLDSKAALVFLEEHSNLTPHTSESLVDKVKEIMHPEEIVETMPDLPLSSIQGFRKIHPYLYERGLTRDIIIEMQVGYDEEHDAIVIPHFWQGKLCGWQWRHLDCRDGEYFCNKCAGTVPKYKSTVGLPKSSTLYGFDRLKNTLTAEDNYAIVVESPMTVLKLLSMGYDNVVGTFGSYGREQGLCLQPIKTVFFWPDNDSAGYKNALRCIDINRIFNSLKIVPAVEGDKSDAGNLNSVEEVNEYLNRAYPSSLFQVHSKDKLASLSHFTTTN